MTLDTALREVKVWLDEVGAYYSGPLARRALNRALLDHIESVAGTFEADAQARSRLLALLAKKTGPGQVASLSMAETFRVVSVRVHLSRSADDDGISARPLSQQSAAQSVRSYFARPTGREPTYTEHRSDGLRVLTLAAGRSVVWWTVWYLIHPPALLTAPPETVLPLDETDAGRVVQLAVRMLQAQKQQDYGAQAQVESRPLPPVVV